MLATWLYVSTNVLTADIEAEIAGIRSVAEKNNPRLSLTGVLLFSGGHFAQFLEGPAAGLEEMKRTICADRRHSNVITLRASQSKERRYPKWWLAYSGRATAIEKILSDSVSEGGVREMMLAMDAFVEGLR